MYSISTIKEAKLAAKRLKNKLDKNKIQINHSLSLELISAIIGYKNWNITSSLLDMNLTTSPFLGIQDTVSYNKIEYLRVDFSSDKPNIKIETSGTGGSSFIINDLNAAEEFSLQLVNKQHENIFKLSDIDAKTEQYKWLIFLIFIYKTSNRIAATSRRGAGNILLTSQTFAESTLMKIISESEFSSDLIECDSNNFNNKWKSYGKIKGINWYGSNSIDDDRVYIFYKGPGKMDAAAYFNENLLYIPYFEYFTDRGACIKIEK